jgi:uncharacterized protein Smg (DUF494 family)
LPKTFYLLYSSDMSFAEVLQELPVLTTEQRQLLIRRALELDNPQLSPEDQELAEARLAQHRQDPGSSISSETMKERLRSRFPK